MNCCKGKYGEDESKQSLLYDHDHQLVECFCAGAIASCNLHGKGCAIRKSSAAHGQALLLTIQCPLDGLALAGRRVRATTSDDVPQLGTGTANVRAEVVVQSIAAGLQATIASCDGDVFCGRLCLLMDGHGGWEEWNPLSSV